MNLLKKTFSILLIMFFVGIAILFGWIKLTVYQLEKDVQSYLVEEKGYQEADISTLKGQFSKLPTFSVDVTFRDEPQKIYYYMRDNGHIVQYNCAFISDPFDHGCKHKEVKGS